MPPTPDDQPAKPAPRPRANLNLTLSNFELNLDALIQSEQAEFEATVAAGRGRGEDESLFARDVNDVLVRREKETRARFKDEVVVTIDGYEVRVPRATAATDSQGNVRNGPDGQPIPRTTTIYDAALKLVLDGTWTDEDLKKRIPVLCHAQHMTPVAVCRMCSVHISSMKRGKITPGRKLVPACQHKVDDNMVVTTRGAADGYNPDTAAKMKPEDMKAAIGYSNTVNSCVSMLAEFLLADNRQPEISEVPRFENELEAVARTLNVAEPRARLPRGGGRNEIHNESERSRRFELPIAPMPVEPEQLSTDRRAAQQAWEGWNALIDERFPYSSRTVVVDHDRCILCDRCARACSEVKPFKVIGHTGRGYTARISFDLDAIMRESSCVQCGECMVSCPTGALSLRRRVQPRAWDDSPTSIPQNPNTPFPAGSGFLTADEMLNVWVYYDSPTRGPRVVFPFRSIPYSYLKWNEGAVRKWEIPLGEKRVLCTEGEYGSTAFLLQGTGKFHIHAHGPSDAKANRGFLARLFGRGGSGAGGGAGTKKPGRKGDPGRLIRTVPGTQFVLGEMACLTHRPRVATVIAEADPETPALQLMRHRDGRLGPKTDADAPPVAVVYEITRNLLDMMQRSQSAREDLQEVYTERALEACMRSGKLFTSLTGEQRANVLKFLLNSQRLEFRRVQANETLVAEGEPASDFYIIRLGTVKVFQTVGGREQVLSSLGAGDYFGEMGLLAGYLQERNLLPPGTETRRRTATVRAVDPVEVVRVPGGVFRRLCERFPEVREQLIAKVAETFRGDGPVRAPGGMLSDYVNQGLFQGQRLLVLDLLSCTRCDECTRACADSHDGHARLLREGMRFGDFLVATSCRSCQKPYCMEGCPVDAIHRRSDHLEVVIENHCIGCGLCEQNCPYGAIQMVTRTGKGVSIPRPDQLAEGINADPTRIAAPRRAVNCDLCHGHEPYCVEACPHEAAFRWDGKTLLDTVVQRAADRG